MFVLRHGQSVWNRLMTETGRDPGIADPVLTDLGHEQARRAAAALARHDIRRVIASPYRRALQTATPIAAAFGLTIEVNLWVREHKAFTCDEGTPASVIAAEWPHLDVSHLPEIWWPPANETVATVRQRAAAFLAHMSEREDWHHTLVVSHWGFLRSLTGEDFQNGCWRKLGK